MEDEGQEKNNKGPEYRTTQNILRKLRIDV